MLWKEVLEGLHAGHEGVVSMRASAARALGDHLLLVRLAVDLYQHASLQVAIPPPAVFPGDHLPGLATAAALDPLAHLAVSVVLP